MDEMKKAKPDSRDVEKNVFWETLMMAAILLVVYLYAFLFSAGDATPIYVLKAGFLIAIVLNLAGIVATFQKRQELGIQLVFYPLLLMGIVVVSTMRERALPVSFLLAVVCGLGYGWVFPKSARRQYVGAFAATLILVWAIELLNPAWRQTTDLMQAGPIGAIFLALVFVVFLTRQSWDKILDFLRLSIRNRLTIIVIGAALVPVVITSLVLGFVTYGQVRAALTQDAFEKLAAVQTIKANQIIGYMDEHQYDMNSLRQTAAALREEAISKLTSVNALKNREISHLFSGWDEDVRDVASDPGVIAGMAQLELGFEELGSAQVRDSFLGNAELMSAGDNAYSLAHIEQHGFFTGYTAIHGYEDAFLIAPDGHIVYSVHKGASFGADLSSANYNDVNLAGLYQRLKSAKAGETFVTDVGWFDEKLTLFIGTPIYNGNAFVGILAYQLPLAQINDIMTERTGLGETGESYIVGPDKLFRTPSRFLEANAVFNPSYAVDTVAANEALNGKSGDAIYFGFRDVQVLAVYEPVSVPNLNWALLSVVDVEEAFIPRISGQENDYFAQYRSIYGYYDILLIDPEGYVFYTVAKEGDYHTNLLTGEYKDTNLGKLVRETLESKSYEFVDFASYAPSANAPAGFFAIPLLSAENEVQMIVAVQIALKDINVIMTEGTGLGETGETYLIGKDQLWRNDSRFLKDLGVNTTILNPSFKVDSEAARSALAGNSGQAQIVDYRGVPVLSVWSPVQIVEDAGSSPEDQQWALIAEIDQEEALAPVSQMAATIAVIIGLTVLIVGALAVFIGSRFALGFVEPIIRLTNTASKVAEGDLNLNVEVKSEDEIGILSGSFNKMTSQLRNVVASLEERVAARTRNLELAAQVGRTVSQVRALDVMLSDAAELIRSQFDLYYVQVYLVNPSQTYLNLQAGTGEVGKQLLERKHRLPYNTGSINGRAAVEKLSVIIADTAKSPTFKANPLLPLTRSEMAVPLMVGEKVVGVLDMQSEIAGSLSTEVLPAFEALAGQLAIAIQNANFLAEVEQSRAEVGAQAARLARTNYRNYLDAIHKAEETGFVFEQNAVVPLAEASPSETGENALVMPISITGAELGNLVVELEGQSPIARTDELLSTVARQIAQQIENLRLLESAERYRAEAEEASRRTVREGWKRFAEAAGHSISYVYDLKEVRPLTGSLTLENTASIPLTVRDEVVGKLAVQGLKTDDQEAVELANAVAQRLSAHIESLRQFEETEHRRIEAEALLRELDIQKYALDQHSIVAITDVQGRITYANDKFVEISKFTREELMGQDHRVLNSGYHPKEFIRNLWVTIANGKVWQGEIRNKNKLGEIYWVDTTIVPILNAEGKPERYLAIRTDITQRKHDEDMMAKRAAELDTVAAISTAASTILDMNEMLQKVVDLTKERFSLYHAHVYVMDDAQENLVLTAGAGEVGKQMVAQKRSISLSNEHSLVARAARTREGVIANNVTEAPDFLPNPLLPDTKSEMAVPMIVGNVVVGVFDVQGNVVDRFTDEDIRIKTTLAAQVATALQNARTFTQAQKQADRESKLNEISQKIQSATTVEAVLQIAARELGHALGAPMTVAQLSMKEDK